MFYQMNILSIAEEECFHLEIMTNKHDPLILMCFGGVGFVVYQTL